MNDKDQRAARKAQLYADVLSAVRSDPAVVWCRPLRDESLIVGQIYAQSLVVFVKLPNVPMADTQLSFMARVNREKGVGFVVHEVGDVAIWIRKLAR